MVPSGEEHVELVTMMAGLAGTEGGAFTRAMVAADVQPLLFRTVTL